MHDVHSIMRPAIGRPSARISTAPQRPQQKSEFVGLAIDKGGESARWPPSGNSTTANNSRLRGNCHRLLPKQAGALMGSQSSTRHVAAADDLCIRGR